MRKRTAPAGTRSPRRWAVAGVLMGSVLGLLAWAPASWLAGALDSATDGRLLLAEARGSVWSGSALLVLGGGRGSRDASVLPSRLEWSLKLLSLQPTLMLRQDCCINGELALQFKPGLGRFSIALVQPGSDWQARWPAAWLAGLGTPWNTLQLSGGLRLSSQGFQLDWAEGRWQQQGRLELDFVNLGSRLYSVAPLGSYRLSVAPDTGAKGLSTLSLQTVDGALLLNGQGTLGPGKARFVGTAQAAPGQESGLGNLLNIIGRRDGNRSLISIG